MGFSGSLISGAGTVAAEHLPTPPAGKSHEVLFLAALN
jgi:hypothetical protein